MVQTYNGGLRYWEKAKGKKGEVYSCDKVQLVFRLRYGGAQSLLDALGAALWLEFDAWESRRWGTYRNQFRFLLPDGCSFWLGVGLVAAGKSRPDDSAKLEYNPNKCTGARALAWVVRQLWARTKLQEPCTLKAWDLAVDLPAQRRDFALCKDARLYEELRRSRDDRTQYVGQRNAPGRCKLYNKQLESGLAQPCTRLEITVAGAAGMAEIVAIWPKVYQLSDYQTNLRAATLNDTDRFIFVTLLEQPERLPELGRRKRERMAAMLRQAGLLVEMDRDACKKICQAVQKLAVRPAFTEASAARWEWADVPDGWRPAGPDERPDGTS